MKILHVVNSDIKGGAPKAAFGISEALRNIGVDSRMFVQRKFSNSEYVSSCTNNLSNQLYTNFRLFIDQQQIRRFTFQNLGRFSFSNYGKDISDYPEIRNADIIHLHWINEGFLSYKSLENLFRLGKKIVWTLHDMWAFTGGCHYAGECIKYENICFECPYLKNSNVSDYSNRAFRLKKELFDNKDLFIVTCSKWLGKIAKESQIFQNAVIDVIPNTIDQNIYRRIEKPKALKSLNLSPNKSYILFGSMSIKEERKGFKYLYESLKILSKKNPAFNDKYELIIFGKSESNIQTFFDIKVNSLGRLNGINDLVAAYNAADIFIAPSIEDNLPNTVMEAISCGLPVCAFKIGGMPDMIDHGKNGYLVDRINSEDLAEGISNIMNDLELLVEMSNNAVRKARDNFSPKIIAEKYLNLYEKILNI